MSLVSITRKRLALFTLFMISVLGGSRLLAVGLDVSPSQDPIDTTYLVSQIENGMLSKHWPGFQVSVIKAGEVIWSRAFGWANIEESIPMTDTTVCVMASVSKTTVAVAAMRLWENGLFQLDSAVGNYLAYPVIHARIPGAIITPRMLMSHSASVVDNPYTMPGFTTGADSPTSLSQFCEYYFKTGSPGYTVGNFGTWLPGTRSQYCNPAVGLAAHLSEVLSGYDTFEEYCHDSIFVPLGMKHTTFMLANSNPDNLAVPYTWNGSGYINYPQWNSPLYPAGYLRSNVSDMSHFLSMLMNGGEYNGVRLLEPGTIDTIMRPQFPSLYDGPWPTQYGLVFWNLTWEGRHLLGHEGLTLGFRTLMYFSPDDNTGVIIIATGQVPEAGDTQMTSFAIPFLDFARDVTDSDGDGVWDLLDKCPGFNDRLDEDQDGFPDGCDNCPTAANPDQLDTDQNGRGDACCCGEFSGGFTGNIDCSSDGKRNLADITRLIDRVYISKEAICCEANGNVDNDDENRTNLADITRLIDHVYISKTETAVCR